MGFPFRVGILWCAALGVAFCGGQMASAQSPADQSVGNVAADTIASVADSALLVREQQDLPTGRITPGGDRLGSAVASIGDLDRDRRRDVLVGAFASDLAGNNTGTLLVLSGRDGDTIRVLSGDQKGERFGTAAAALPDLDGDAVDDLAVGAPGWDGGDSAAIDAGRVYVYSGAEGRLIYTVEGTFQRGRLGISLAPLSDLDGDGIADFAAGQSQRADSLGVVSGTVWILSGADGRRLNVLESGVHGDRFGPALCAAGDVDGDGYGDMLVGAYRDSRSEISAGAAYVFSGRTGERIYALKGDQLMGQFGYAVGGGADVDADGRADFLVGARFDDRTGGRAGSVALFSGMSGRRLREFPARHAGEFFGSAVVFGPDADADGWADVIVGAVRSGEPGRRTGAVYIISSRQDTVILRRTGESAEDGFGESIAVAGDADGDGTLDLIVGASRYDGPGMDAGKAYMISGATGDTIWTVTGTSTLPRKDSAQTPAPAPLASLETLREETEGFDFPVFDSTEVDMMPLIRRSVAAVYPPSAAGSGLTGWVYVRVLVRSDGSAERMEVEEDSGLGADFREAAMAAVSEWAFLAATRNEEPVACWATFPIGFAPPGVGETLTDSLVGTTPVFGSESRGALPQDSAISAAPGDDSTALDSSGQILPGAVITPAELSADSRDTLEPNGDSVASRMYEVSEVDRAPELIATVEPDYPAAARAAGDTCTVTLSVLVDTAGGVREAAVTETTVSGKGFESAARQAVRRWRYTPGMKGGVAVLVWVEERVEFRIP